MQTAFSTGSTHVLQPLTGTPPTTSRMENGTLSPAGKNVKSVGFNELASIVSKP